MVDWHTADLIVTNLQNLHERGRELRAHAMRMLNELPHFDWSGVYRLEGELLVLDEYVGAETDHTEIPVGRGVCGTAVAEDRNQVIEDVRELENYLACSVETRSELVVLIRDQDGQVLGQIDIDGHKVGAFDASDEQMLNRVAEVLAERWK
jgi:L-methionine (R)-S-oxide reductase